MGKIAATLASAGTDSEQIGLTKREKGVSIVTIVDRHGLPLAITRHAANHLE